MKLYEKNNINLGTVFFNYWAVHLLELDTNNCLISLTHLSPFPLVVVKMCYYSIFSITESQCMS